MKLPPVKFLILAWLGCWTSLLAQTVAAEWKSHRFDGRDYVSLDDIAAFHGFPKPAPLVPPTPEAIAASIAAAGAVGAASETEFGATTAAARVATAKTVVLESGPLRLEVTPGLSDVSINGVKQWLAFPVRNEDGRAYVSRLDATGIIGPRLRPERIAGLTPVRTVILDPGHGGHDRGAVSRFGFEKDFALDIASRTRVLLEKAGYKVLLTRSDDTFIPLEERPALANRTPDSIFVSIHFNASNAGAAARGFEIFSIAPRGAASTNDAASGARDFPAERGNVAEIPSGALAGSIYHALLGQIPLVDRGLKHARFAVLRRCVRPAVLVECGFVSNPGEVALISGGSWRARIAEALADGVAGYANLAAGKGPPRTLAEYRAAARPAEAKAPPVPEKAGEPGS